MDIKLILQIIGIIFGLLYLWLEYKANIWLWLVGMIMPFVHGYLYYRQGLYADCGMQLYYVLAGIYGWIIWLLHSPTSKKTNYEICHTPRKASIIIAAVFVFIYAALVYILIHYTNSTVPYADGFTTALAVIATWMLSRKYVEQWLVWLVADATTVCLYFYKDIPITACLYMIYTCLAIAGYLRWMKIIREKHLSDKI